MTSFNGFYPGEIGGGVKKEDVRYARIVKNDANFNDRGAYCDKKPLYSDDKEPCELLFRLNEKNSMVVYEENCHLIYGGAGVTWGGEYFKYH